MDREGARAVLQHYFDCSAAGDEDRAHEFYLDDAVLEFPQSGERFEGVPNFRECLHHGGCGPVGRRPLELRLSIHEFRGEKIAREKIYYAEPFDAPAWRAQWRAAPPP